MSTDPKAHTSDALPAGFWWFSAIIILVIALGLARCLLMPPLTNHLSYTEAEKHNHGVFETTANTDIENYANASLSDATNDNALNPAVKPADSFPDKLSNSAGTPLNNSQTEQARASSVTPKGAAQTVASVTENSSPDTNTEAVAPTKPRLPARESISTLLSTIEDRKTNATARYRSPRDTNTLSRSERVKARTEYTHENFQVLCADCHLLNDAEEWQADLGADLCTKVNCGDHTQLAFYINRFMPPEDPQLCEGACASELALYILYDGNAALAAMHQMAPSILMHAGIEIRDTESGTVILSRPPLTSQE